MLEQQAETGAHARTEEGVEAHHRRRLPPEERRGEILGAALTAFAEVGYEQATLNDVAERLGVTKGCLYHYFDSKEQLLLELVRGRMGRWAVEDEEWLGGVTGPRDEVLQALVGRIWAHLHEPGQLELIALILSVLPKFPEVGRVLFDEVIRPGRRLLRQALMRDIEGAEPVSPGEVEAVVAAVPAMLMGVALCRHVFGGIDPLPLSEERLGDTASWTLLRGIGTACAGTGGRCEGEPGGRGAG